MFKNSRGISLVEIIISLALLSVAGVILIKSSALSNKQQSKSKVTLGISDLQLAIGTEVKNVILNSKDSQGKKTQGLCAILEPESNATPPVSAINIDMKKLPLAINKTRVLNTVKDLGFSEDNSQGCSSDDYEFCFKLDQKGSYEQNLSTLNTKLKIKIEPVFMNPKNGKVFTKLLKEDFSKKFDSKAIGFNFVVALTHSENGKPITKTTESFEWSGLIGNCNYKLAGKDYILSVTGMEHVENPDVIFNRAGFASNKNDPLTVTFSKSIAQVGAQSVNGQAIFTASINNIETSCIEYNYKCPKQSANSRIYYAIGTKGKINHVSPNRLDMPVNSPIKLQYTIDQAGKSISSVTGVNLKLRTSTTADCSSEFQTANINSQCSNESPFSTTLPSSLGFSTTLEEGSGMASKTCQAICRPETGYNSTANGNNINNLWTGVLNIILPNYQNEKLSFKAGERIVCTACYMKNCDQIGLGTFGKMEAQPYQPLDSNIPECVQYDEDPIKYNNFPYKEITNVNLDTSSANYCVAARVSGDSLIYSLEDCAKALPVACYGYGGFRIAMDFSATNKKASAVKNADARARCYEMGREITDIGKLNNYLKTASTDIPKNGPNYDYVNIVNQGMFVAPQEKQDIRNLRENIEKQSLAQSVSKFWVGVAARGNNGLGSALEPTVPTIVKDSDIHAVFFDGKGNLIHERHQEKLPTQAGNVAILYHDIKFKGVRYVEDENPMGDNTSLPFLCRQKTAPWKFKLSSSRSTKFVDGVAYCNSDNMMFLPPATPNEWILAMLAVNPTHSKFPFPNGSNLNKAAWVSIEKIPSATAQANWQVYQGSMSAYGSSVTWLDTSAYKPDVTKDKFALINNLGIYVDPTSTLVLSSSTGKYDIAAYGTISLKKDDKTITLYKNNSTTKLSDLNVDQLIDRIKSNLSSNDIKYTKDGDKVKLEVFGSSLKFNANSDHNITSTGVSLATIKELCIVDSYLSINCTDSSPRVRLKDLQSESTKIYWKLRNLPSTYVYKAALW